MQIFVKRICEAPGGPSRLSQWGSGRAVAIANKKKAGAFRTGLWDFRFIFYWIVRLTEAECCKLPLVP